MRKKPLVRSSVGSSRAKRIEVVAAGNANYLASKAKTVTVKVKVK